MASKSPTPSAPAVVDVDVVDASAAIQPRSHKVGLDYSSVDIDTLTYEQLQQIPGFMSTGGTPVDKGWLLGVPHIVTAVTFWAPKPTKDGGTRMGGITLDATVAGVDALERQIRFRRVLQRIDSGNGQHETHIVTSLDELGFYPGERITYNDESTGIRRSVVKWLIQGGLITLSAKARSLSETQACDLPWTEWESFAESTLQGSVTVPRFTRLPSGNPFLIHAPRGLRVSEYSNDYVDEAVTYYFG
jgi:hypothetical protein